MVLLDIHNECHKLIVESRRYKTVKDGNKVRERESSVQIFGRTLEQVVLT